MRNSLILTGMLLGALPAGEAPLQAQDMENAEVKAEPIGGGIYFMATGYGGNMAFCAGEDGVFLIDDQFAPLSEKILAAIGEVTDRPVQFVINTHYHGDHTGGNENLGKAGAVLIAHENVRSRMSVEQFDRVFERSRPPSPPGNLPVVTFTEALTFYRNGEEIDVIHVAHAHTDGDAIIHFRNADVIHMGDTFFHGLYPFIDVSAGGSFEGTIAACDAALALAGENTRIIPGHGSMGTRADLRAYRDMLATLLERFEKAVGEGKSLEEIQAMGLSKEWDEQLGGQYVKPDVLARSFYLDLTREGGR